jgi:hypothetical protein
VIRVTDTVPVLFSLSALLSIKLFDEVLPYVRVFSFRSPVDMMGPGGNFLSLMWCIINTVGCCQSLENEGMRIRIHSPIILFQKSDPFNQERGFRSGIKT